MNISNFIYKIIEQNEHLFNLKQYDVNHSIDLTLLNKYIELNNDFEIIIIYKLIEKLLKNILYIDCDQFIKIYEKNVDEIINYYKQYILILYISPYIVKSNVFFSLYFLYLLKKKILK